MEKTDEERRKCRVSRTDGKDTLAKALSHKKDRRLPVGLFEDA
jgi:hypothetical protein